MTIPINSFAASDIGLVHAGYAPYRRRLLAAGVRFFEMRAENGNGDRKGPGVGSRLRGAGTGSTAALRSGASRLHAKTSTVDRERLFVGSFSLDPRSVRLNTERGFVIESPRLAGAVADGRTHDAPERACAVSLSAGGALSWEDRRAGKRRMLTREPGMSALDRAVIAVASRLPIAWLL